MTAGPDLPGGTAVPPTPDIVMAPDGPGTVRISWPADVAAVDVRRAVDEVLADGGVHRVEARVPLTDRRDISVAGRAGLRREGIERGVELGGHRVDVMRLARLADDPAPTSPEGFRAVLNAGLNRTRVITQALTRDDLGRVLLCELTYKTFWDLPGGVVDPRESPAEGLRREVTEELGLGIEVGDLLAVSWLPPWQGWDDACLFVFAAQSPADLVEQARLERREIAQLHWCPVEELDEHVADYTARVIRAALAAPSTVYLEDGRLP